MNVYEKVKLGLIGSRADIEGKRKRAEKFIKKERAEWAFVFGGLKGQKEEVQRQKLPKPTSKKMKRKQIEWW